MRADLIDRNWRRSGNFLYWVENVKSCCAQHAIRCGQASALSQLAHGGMLTIAFR